jgi:histidinol-phosphate aminotransferase
MTQNYPNELTLSTNVCYDAVLLDQLNDILKNISADDLYIYKDEYSLYHALQQYHGIPVENLAIGLGLGELYPRILEVFKNQRILVITPTWFYANLICDIKQLDYDVFEYTDFFDLDLDRLLTQPHDVLYLANPNGMNGTVLGKEIIKLLAQHFKYVIVDEAYSEFSDVDSSVINEQIDNVVVLKTLSKSLALAGLRFGYCMANPDIILKIQEIRPAYASNALAVYLVPKILPLIESHVERMKAVRSYVESYYSLRKSHGNFVLYGDEFSVNVKTKSVHENWNRLTLCDIGTWNDIIQKP